MSTPKSVDKTMAAPNSGSSAKKKISATHDNTPPSDQAAKPIKKKIPKTPQLNDATPNAGSVAKDSSPKPRHKPSMVTKDGELMDVNNKHGQKGQETLDKAPPPKLKSLSSPQSDGTKKIIKKKPKPEEDQGIPNENNKVQDHVRNVQQVKKSPNHPETGARNIEKLEQANHVEENAQDYEPSSMSGSPEAINNPKPLKKKIKKPITPSNAEPKPTMHSHDKQLENEVESDREEKFDREHENQHMKIDSEDHSSNQDEGLGEDEQDEHGEDQNKKQAEGDYHEEDDEYGEEHDEAEEDTDNGEPSEAEADGDDPFQDTPTKSKNYINKGTIVSDYSNAALNNPGNTIPGSKTLNGASELPDGIAGDRQMSATNEAGKPTDNTTDTNVFSEDNSNSAEKVTEPLSQERDTLDSISDKAQGEELGKAVSKPDEVQNRSTQDGAKTKRQFTNDQFQDNKTSGDPNELQEKLSNVNNEKEHGINAIISGFTPKTGRDGDIKAGGITINVQTTKEGMNLTINIPGNFKQQ